MQANIYKRTHWHMLEGKKERVIQPYVTKKRYYSSELCFGTNFWKHGTLPFQNGKSGDPSVSKDFLKKTTTH